MDDLGQCGRELGHRDALDGDKCALVQKKRGLQSYKGPVWAMCEIMRVPGDCKAPPRLPPQVCVSSPCTLTILPSVHSGLPWAWQDGYDYPIFRWEPEDWTVCELTLLRYSFGNSRGPAPWPCIISFAMLCGFFGSSIYDFSNCNENNYFNKKKF